MRPALLLPIFLPIFFAALPLYSADLNDLTWTITGRFPNAQATITHCNEDATGELIIPTWIGATLVIGIGEAAFSRCNNLTSITIGGGVRNIGNYAFRNCTGLTNFTWAGGGRSSSIGNAAFENCSSLTTITIPSGVRSIGNEAFRGSGLTSITFQGAAPAVGENIFLNVPEGATAYVQEQVVASFGAEGSIWEGLTIAIQRPAITACGFVDAATFFIEFEPAGTVIWSP